MKRPQGFQPPAAPAAPATPATPVPLPRKPRARAALPAAWWLNTQLPASAEATPAVTEVIQEAITEPIAVQAQTAQGAQGAQTAQSAQAAPAAQGAAEQTGPLAPVTLLSSAVPSLPSTPGPTPADPDAETLTPSSARARLRAATKARRAYERAEVRRFTRHLRRRRAVWLTGIGALLALGLFVAVGTFSPLMALTTIQVEGANRLVADDVSAALGGQLGTPLPLVDLGEVKSTLAEFSIIQSFSTESRPPNTLVVRIVEREPIGAIAGPNGFDLVDPAGVVIQTTPERPEGFPILEAAGAEGLAAAGNVVQALPAETRAQLDVVRAASTDDVNLVLFGGTSVAWGSAEESAAKALVLGKLMAAVPQGTVSVYDVSSPASPVVR